MAPVEPSSVRLQSLLENYIKTNVVMIFTKSTCGYCKKVKDLFTSLNIAHNSIDLDTLDNGRDLHKFIVETYKQQTVPCVFIQEKLIGGYAEVAALHGDLKLIPLVRGGSPDTLPQVRSRETGRWSPTPGRRSPAGMASPAGMMSPREKSPVAGHKSPSSTDRRTPEPTSYDYDLIVIGGGSGGLAAAKEAADLKMKVACLDFVKPSEQGSTWGLGGTCVNVGCIPKKLMHQAAILGHSLKDAREFGWEFGDKGWFTGKTKSAIKHNWATLTSAIQDHIGGLNWNYRVQLRTKSVNYVNAYAEFIDPHRVKCTKKNGKEEEMTAKYFIIATGGRPRYPEIPGAKEHCITSDDLFSLDKPPGKTLLVGASYVSLECAGFLAALGYDVTVMVRSILLRGFDQQMAEGIGKFMETEAGVKFIRRCVPTKVEKVTHKLKVTAIQDGKEVVGDYDTVMIAVGRDPCTKNIGLDNIDVKIDKSGFIVAKDDEQTTCPNVYAIGDVLAGRPELTPVAIHAGKLLSRRLFTSSKLKCDYTNIPTTVFTPIEYGAIGLSEEDSIAKFGENGIEVYHANYFPLEWTIPHRTENVCYAKLVCVKAQKNRVVGFHVLGPNAGEMTQGFAIGIKMGATKDQFDNCVGIHPTCAEVFTKLAFTKASGADVTATGC